jgi:hypothetical protein
MRRALNCTLIGFLSIAALWLLDPPDVGGWAMLIVMGTGMYWADAEIRELRSTQ